ncbi:MAG TPA: FAD-dependent oxidoreductase [Candidatus Nanoarchaeia archaeon]|nr:FAD-dependent oxidoreductase [Candidatus Nanoarchaeia archaeon]
MKNLVIIGGGFAGAYAAKKLEPFFNLILIDTKDYFEFTPGILRTLIEPGHAAKIQVKHSTYLPRTKIIVEEVVDLNEHKVITAKHKISYDYLIICSGSIYNRPIKEKNMVFASRSKELQEYAQKLSKSKNVLIIGGGIVGVELAAEVIEKFPLKKIILVQANSELMPRNHPKARKLAQQFLEKRGVEVILNEKVEYKNNQFMTNSGKILTPDLTFFCTGIKPNYDFLKKNFSESLNKSNFVEVDDTLQVKGRPHIFAAGDIAHLPEEKTAQGAEKQAQVVIDNILRLEHHKPLKKYYSLERPMVISLGKKNGLFLFRNIVLTGVIPALLKKIVEFKTMRRYYKK